MLVPAPPADAELPLPVPLLFPPAEAPLPEEPLDLNSAGE